MFLVLGLEKGKKTNTSTIVQEPFLGTKFIESDIEADLDMEKRIEIKKLHNQVISEEAAPQ